MRPIVGMLGSRASGVGPERSGAIFDEACNEHARRVARAIDQEGGT